VGDERFVLPVYAVLLNVFSFSIPLVAATIADMCLAAQT
jgi:hypothetical protein